MTRKPGFVAISGCLLFLAGVLVGGFLPGLNVAPSPADGVQTKEIQDAIELKLKQLKLDLPPVKQPTNTLVSAVRVGDMLYVSGTGPSRPDGKAWTGRLGQDMDVDEGKKAARQVGMQILAVVKAELGGLDKVERLVKTLGMVNATPEFKEHPKVINGFSDLMVEVFGEKNGKGARSAVGMGSLPGGIPVEIEAIFQVKQ